MATSRIVLRSQITAIDILAKPGAIMVSVWSCPLGCSRSYGHHGA
jgi:hypothetical protein